MALPTEQMKRVGLLISMNFGAKECGGGIAVYGLPSVEKWVGLDGKNEDGWGGYGVGGG